VEAADTQKEGTTSASVTICLGKKEEHERDTLEAL
jgi:hypothetical protein